MSAPGPTYDELKNFETEQQRSELWALLQATAHGREQARAALLNRLTTLPHLPSALTELAVHHAGGTVARAQCAAHLEEPKWSRWLPLQLQEYTAVFPSDTRFHETIQTAMTESGWAQAFLQRLQLLDEAGVQAARAMLGELDSIANEAAGLLGHLPTVRARIGSSLHALQAQALTRAELVLGCLRGRKVLEVGPQEGGLLLEMLRSGASVTGVDLGPRIEHPSIIQGDFLTADLPRPFELIIATAVFEAASCSRGERDSESRNNSPAVLKRFHELTEPGGVVVLENIMFPIPFSRRDAEDAGFEVLRLGMPGVNLRVGGRSCVLKRKS